MMVTMSKRALMLLAIAGCTIDEPTMSTIDQYGMNMQGMNMQGMNMQGMNMQGMNMQGMNMQGFQLGGATLGGRDLVNVRVEAGEVVAERDGVTLRGAALVGAHFVAHAASNDVPPVVAEVEYRITDVAAESASYDPTSSGATYLYTLEQYRADTSSWVAACDADSDGRRVAIPLQAMWNAHGDRVESTTLFTFACTTGVIAKCYRWGYRPWLTGYGDLASMHWTCTRLARADYCGNGIPHTQDGTWINVWDTLPPPGPIQQRDLVTGDMLFEASWNTGGAVCMSHARWLLGEPLDQLCPDRLVAPGGSGATVCDTPEQAMQLDPSAMMFNESYGAIRGTR
jgi:hypothetical protein